MLTVCAIVLLVISALLAFLLWQKQQGINRLRLQNQHLNSELTLVLEKLAASESSDLSADGLLDKVVRGLVALGVPGLVLLVATAVSGHAGAAAITTAARSNGWPWRHDRGNWSINPGRLGIARIDKMGSSEDREACYPRVDRSW
jgi:hypothetical protein